VDFPTDLGPVIVIIISSYQYNKNEET